VEGEDFTLLLGEDLPLRQYLALLQERVEGEDFTLLLGEDLPLRQYLALLQERVKGENRLLRQCPALPLQERAGEDHLLLSHFLHLGAEIHVVIVAKPVGIAQSVVATNHKTYHDCRNASEEEKG